MACDVFVSYSTKDKLAADAACAALEAAQIRCWIAPRDILPGADWGASIIDAMDRCRVMVLIFSASANDSPQIRNEIAHAVQRGVPVIPVRIEDIQPAKSLAYFMGGVHWLDALTPPLEAHLKRLAESVRTMLQLVSPADMSAAAAAAALPVVSSGSPAIGAPSAPTQLSATSADPGDHRTGAAVAPRRTALAGVAIAGLLIAGAGILYVSPLWEQWFPSRSTPGTAAVNHAPAEAPPAPAPFAEQLLARFALILPSFSQASREQRVRDYMQAKVHKAYAVSLQPPGSWRATGRADAQVAEEAALENCQMAHGSPCVLIAVNDTVPPLPPDGNWLRRDMPRVRYAGNFDPYQIPSAAHLRQRADISGYAAAPGPKAAAYHPGIGVFVVTGADSQRAAEEKVLDVCNSNPNRIAAEGLCFLYAAGNQVVLPQRLRKPMS